MNYSERDPDQRPDPYYDPYASYFAAHARKPKKHTGLVVVLVILALLTGAVSWAVNFLGVQASLDENGLVISMGSREPEQAQEAVRHPDTSAPVAQMPEEEQKTEQAVPAAKPGTDGDTVLQVQQSALSAENHISPDAQALSLQAIYEKVIPSVASISSVLPNGSSTGTGIVMSEDGYVITNFHVIDGAVQISVLLEGDAQYPAVLVGGDETTDLAVLKIQDETVRLVPAEFGDSDMLRVGDLVVAIGDPLGIHLRGTMTDGIVSAINRDLNVDGRRMTLIQTNAALNSGNSGGPLINCYGQVIGINTIKMSSYASSTSVEGLGFAIPITAAKPILDELIANGYVAGRPAIGIQGATMDVRAQFFYGMPGGVGVNYVDESSDAYAKGLSPDDVIVGFNGMEIGSLDDLVRAKSELTAGDTVRLTVYRGGRYYEVDVVLMDQTSSDLY